MQIELGVSSATVRPQVWPLPSAIPWSSIKLEAWHSAGLHNPLPVCDSSEWFSRFGHAVERSLQGFVEEAPGKHLPTKCFGRGKRLKPQSQTQAVPPKPSRPGEVTLRPDLLGAEVLRWFRQLRRLQSLVHSLRSNNDAATAQVYRLDLWRAILHGKGFRGGFLEWWRTRRVRLAGSPNAVPLALPGRVLAQAIYLDFRANFRDFESWHLRQRSQQLQAKYDKTQKQLYLELRGEAPPQVDTLTLHHVHEVVKTEPSRQLVTLATEPDDRGASLWTLEGAPVAVVEVNRRVCTLQTDVFPAPGQVLEQVQTLHSTADVQNEFIRLWSARWLKHRDKTPQDWTRVLAFSRAFLPSSPFALPSISLEDWNQALRRFRPTAARGPDGWAKEDLTFRHHALRSCWPCSCALNKGRRSDRTSFFKALSYCCLSRMASSVRMDSGQSVCTLSFSEPGQGSGPVNFSAVFALSSLMKVTASCLTTKPLSSGTRSRRISRSAAKPVLRPTVSARTW